MYEAERQPIRLSSNTFRSKSMSYPLLKRIPETPRNSFECEVAICGRVTSINVGFLKFHGSTSKEPNRKAIVAPTLVADFGIAVDPLVGLRE